MMLNSPFYFNVYKNAFSEEWCDAVTESAYENSEVTGQAEFGYNGRSCDIRWLADSWIFNEVVPKINHANEDSKWNFHYEYLEPLQFTEYKPGHFYNWHIDSYPNLKDGEQRKLSFSIMLSDPSEYVGGMFKIVSGLPNVETEWEMEVPLEKGDLLVFPSCIPHKVEVIDKGLRRSLVGWCMGPAWR